MAIPRQEKELEYRSRQKSMVSNGPQGVRTVLPSSRVLCRLTFDPLKEMLGRGGEHYKKKGIWRGRYTPAHPLLTEKETGGHIKKKAGLTGRLIRYHEHHKK